MVIKENFPSGNKRPRLSEVHINSAQRGTILNVNNGINRQQVNLHNHHHDQRSRFDNDSGRWSELFDSFKDTNHLKELHCR